MTGGVPPVTINALDLLPGGLTLDQGVISGTPTTAGTMKFNVRATDATARTSVAFYSLTVASPLAITTATLPKAYVGAPYQQSVSTSRGTPPSTLQIVGGQLPPGLALANNAITGSAGTAGTWTFQMKATDAAQDVATKTFSVTAEKSATVMVPVSPLSAVGFNKPPKDYDHVTKTVAIPGPLSAQGFNKPPKDYQTVQKMVPINQSLTAVGFAKAPQQ